MLDMTRTNFGESAEYPLVAAAAQILEGSGLVRTIEGGVAKVGNGSGADTEVFAGVAVSQHYPATTGVMVERLTMSAASANLCTATLKRTPKAPTTDVLVKSGATVVSVTHVAAASVDTATEYNINTSTNVLTLDDAYAGLEVDVIYRYDLTVIERTRMYGDTQSQASVGEVTDTVGVVQQGVVFTDQFDPSDDWAAVTAATVIKLGANGIFTMASGATGATVPASVEAIPTTDVPFLGLRIRAA